METIKEIIDEPENLIKSIYYGKYAVQRTSYQDLIIKAAKFLDDNNTVKYVGKINDIKRDNATRADLVTTLRQYLPITPNNCKIAVYKLYDKEYVQFSTSKNNANFTITFSDNFFVKSGERIRICTGYVFKIDDPRYVIIPSFSYNLTIDSNPIPLIYCQDADDTGVYIISFLNVSENDISQGSLIVTLNVFESEKSLIYPYVIDSNNVREKKNSIKKRDQRSDRVVINPKTAFLPEKYTINDNYIGFELQGDSTSKLIFGKDDYLLFMSRRRECLSTNLLTFPGFFDLKQNQRVLTPTVFQTIQFTDNSHCFVYLTKIVEKYKFIIKKTEVRSLKIINGSWNQNTDKYTFKELKKNLNGVVKLTTFMTKNANAIQNLQKKHADIPLDVYVKALDDGVDFFTMSDTDQESKTAVLNYINRELLYVKEEHKNRFNLLKEMLLKLNNIFNKSTRKRKISDEENYDNDNDKKK